jgi:hypothetical protein
MNSLLIAYLIVSKTKTLNGGNRITHKLCFILLYTFIRNIVLSNKYLKELYLRYIYMSRNACKVPVIFVRF